MYHLLTNLKGKTQVLAATAINLNEYQLSLPMPNFFPPVKDIHTHSK